MRTNMHTWARLEAWLLKRADRYMDHRRRIPPPRARLAAANIVAHRGIYDNRGVFENTMPAFERFAETGGWGIELDIHWTRDGVPVVSHDPDGRRLFGVARRIAGMDYQDLKRFLPLIPTLEEVVGRFGGRQHLMIEVKSLPDRDLAHPRETLADLLAGLTPGSDYHFLSLNPDRLSRLRFFPPEACLPIAQMNLHRVGRAVRDHAWGGLAGHYTMIGRRTIAAMHRRGLAIGTGYVNSVNCLYREVNRGVDFLFSDRAVALQQVVTNARSVHVVEGAEGED
jgi:glycerophosphoryl diester phosphodiesterase